MRLVMLATRLDPAAEPCRRLLGLARALSAQGVSISVAAGRLERPLDGLDSADLGASGWRLSWAALSHLLKRSGTYDAVWCPAGSRAAVGAVLAAYWNGLPALLQFGGGHENVEGFRSAWLLRRLARFNPWLVAEDGHQARRLMGGARLRCWELPEGVDAAEFSPVGDSGKAARRAQLGLGEGLVFACPSPGGESVRALVAAWVASSGGKATLALAGSGPTEDTYPAGVRFVGRAHELHKLYQAADAAVFCPGAAPGRVLEAMAAGLAVLAPGDRGTLALVEEGRTGLTYEPAYPQLVEQRLKEMLAKPARLAQLGREARAEVLKRHSYERLAQRYVEILESRFPKGRVLPRVSC